jgi:hypothetical protein
MQGDELTGKMHRRSRFFEHFLQVKRILTTISVALKVVTIVSYISTYVPGLTDHGILLKNLQTLCQFTCCCDYCNNVLAMQRVNQHGQRLTELLADHPNLKSELDVLAAAAAISDGYQHKSLSQSFGSLRTAKAQDAHRQVMITCEEIRTKYPGLLGCTFASKASESENLPFYLRLHFFKNTVKTNFITRCGVYIFKGVAPFAYFLC